MKVHPLALNSALLDYWEDGHSHNLRLGQFLMNTFGSEPNPTIFYERDNEKALTLFMETYMEDFE